MSSFQIWSLLQVSKKLARGQHRAEKSKDFEKIRSVMISYKRNVLERQSLSEVKMGRGCPICERVHTNIGNTLKTTFLNVKLQRLCKSHHLQFITSSKDSEKLEKSLCAKNKAKELCWMPVVFRPSDNTASLIGMILSLTLLNGPRNI